MALQLSLQDYVRIENDIWLVSSKYNGLYKYNLCEKKVKKMAEFQEEPFIKRSMFKKICVWENKMIFLPYTAKCIYLYDFLQGKMEKIEITVGKKYENQVHINFDEYGLYKDWIYMVGCEYPGIIKVNLKSAELIELNVIPPEIYEKAKEKKSYVFGSSVVNGNMMYLPSRVSNEIIELDMFTDHVKIYQVGNANNTYGGIFHIGRESYYLLNAENDNLTWWNSQNGMYREYEICLDQHSAYRCLYDAGESIWMVLSGSVTSIYQIKKQNMKVKKIDFAICGKSLRIEFAQVHEGQLLFVNDIDGQWYETGDDGAVHKLRFSIEEPEEELIWRKAEDVCYGSTFLQEDGVVTLKPFLARMKRESISGTAVKNIERAGDFIYKSCKST